MLRAWLDHFDKRFIGLTGSEAAIDAAQIAANLSPAKKSAVRPDGAYEVGHAAFVLAYTKDNLAHVIYPGGVRRRTGRTICPTWRQKPGPITEAAGQSAIQLRTAGLLWIIFWLLNFLGGFHTEKKKISEFVPVVEPVTADIDVKVHAFRQPELGISLWKIDSAVIDAHVLGEELYF